jgi:hypothetical protein
MTGVKLGALLMPNGEILSMGKSLGYFEEFKGHVSLR